MISLNPQMLQYFNYWWFKVMGSGTSLYAVFYEIWTPSIFAVFYECMSILMNVISPCSFVRFSYL